MSEPIRILYVDDYPLDRELVRDALEKEGGGFQVVEASSRIDFEARLAEGDYDLVLSDFNILGFDGLQVLDAVRAKDQRVPVVIVTGTGSEEVAAEAIKRGAADYVIKTTKHIQRLPLTIHAALENKWLKEERDRAAATLRENEERYRQLFRHSPVGVMLYDTQLHITECNDRFAAIFQSNQDRLVCLDMKTLHDQRLLPALSQVLKGEEASYEGLYRPATSSAEICASLRTAPLFDQHGRVRGGIGIFEDITDRKRAEEALRESEERYRSVFSNAAIGIDLVDAKGCFVQVNDSLAQMLAYSADELLNMTIFDVTEPEDIEISKMNHDKMLRGLTDSYRFEKRYIRKDGGVMWADVSASTIRGPDGVHIATIGLIADITERKRAEESLRESESKYKALVENIPMKIFIKDRDSVYVSCNENYARDVGITANQCTGKTDYEFFPRELADQYRADDERIMEKGQTEDLEEKYIQGEQEVWVHTIKTPIRKEDGTVVGILGIFWDVTERKEAEQERTNLQAQLSQAQKMEAIGTLAGGIAHDFNNILQVALGYSEVVLADEQLPGRFRADLQKIYESSRRGADLVKRLLTFSSKTEINLQPLNLNHRMKEMQKMIRRTIPRMIDIQIVPGENLAKVHADPTQIDQILMNLAVNARDAMPEGGKLILESANIILDEEYLRINVEATPGQYVQLTVTDTGLGMDSETLTHIFEPFYTTKGAGEGTGLGLAMVHGIVKQHGGHITCHSEPGHGTTFRIYFPAEVADEEAEQAKVMPMPRGGSETILLVDDEEYIRELGSRILQKAGYKVIMASNGREALDVYRTKRDQVELVVLDLIMPEMGGGQCLEGLLSLDPSVRVVIASGYSANGLTKDALLAGAKGFVNKPYNIRQMMATIREVLEEG